VPEGPLARLGKQMSKRYQRIGQKKENDRRLARNPEVFRSEEFLQKRNPCVKKKGGKKIKEEGKQKGGKKGRRIRLWAGRRENGNTRGL